MLASLVIVFREVFEMAIVICVVLAAVKEISFRFRWIFLGVAIGAFGACLLAVVMSTLSVFANHDTEQIIKIIILAIATVLIGYTVIWMKQHGRTLAQHLKEVGSDVVAGNKPLYTLSVVVGLAVLREGAEIVLFLYGLAASGNTTWIELIFGSSIGLLAGVSVGVIMYLGLLRIPVRQMFSITSVLLTLIAAGMAANVATKLISIGILPALVTHLWDTSNILSQHSILGKFFAVLIGYKDQPSGMALLFYIATVGIIILLPKIIRHIQPQKDSIRSTFKASS